MDNRDVVAVLESTIALLELHDEDPRKVKSYGNAIFNLERLDSKLRDLNEEEILKINGVGPSITKAILEILQSGTLELREDLIKKTPDGLLELLKIRGIGAGKIRTAWTELEVESVEDMLQAIDSGELGQLKGFGAKTISNLRQSLHFFISNKEKVLLPGAIEISEELIKGLKELDNITAVDVVGETRLKRPIVNHVSILIGSDNQTKIKDQVSKLGVELNEKTSGPYALRGLYEGSSVELLLCDPGEYEAREFLETGSEKHFSVLRDKGIRLPSPGEPFSEQQLYGGTEIIAPHRREGSAEFQVKNEELVDESDLKGILHCHSTYSDGVNTLEEMAEAAKSLGYEYLGIADHSKSAFYYANGMYENRVQEQHKEIDSLNTKLAPFKIFKGIESDILPDGDLDYENEFLANFDFVVASIHSVLNMDIEKATARILRAIENPYTTILGHLTGRVLLQRQGYPVDHKTIIDHCAKHDVVIEINSHPSRLDLDWTWIRYAMDKGVMLSINPDAHKAENFDHMKYGVWMGQKGGLPREMTLNAKSQAEIQSFFDNRKSKISS